MKLVLICIIPLVFSYLELAIKRYPKQTQSNIWDNNKCNSTNIVSEYTQICYHKDISYSLQLMHNTQYYYLAIDFTTPISWLKGPYCRIEKTKKYCSKIEKSFAGQLKKQLKRVEKQLKAQLMIFDPQEQLDEKIIIGSLDPIVGKLQKARNITFLTKDKGKFLNFFDLLLMGMFLSSEQQIIQLKNTNFIKADLINSHTNRLSDGAISLRFDEDSQNSFLNQIFKFLQSTHKIVTIYLGQNSVITIGDLSVKNAQGGYSGINWIKLDEKKYPQVSSIFVQFIEDQVIKEQKLTVQVIITLSASYISIPEEPLKKLLKNLSQLGFCKIGTFNFIQCRFEQSKNYQQQRITFKLTKEIKISFQIKELIRSKKGKITTLNLRISQTSYIILGEPLFKKYFVAFDYQNNKIGIAERRYDHHQHIKLIPIIQFLIIGFIVGCGILLCYIPCKLYSVRSTDEKLKKRLQKSKKKKKQKYFSLSQKSIQQDQRYQIIESDEVQGI